MKQKLASTYEDLFPKTLAEISGGTHKVTSASDFKKVLVAEASETSTYTTTSETHATLYLNNFKPVNPGMELILFEVTSKISLSKAISNEYGDIKVVFNLNKTISSSEANATNNFIFYPGDSLKSTFYTNGHFSNLNFFRMAPTQKGVGDKFFSTVMSTVYPFSLSYAVANYTDFTGAYSINVDRASGIVITIVTTIKEYYVI